MTNLSEMDASTAPEARVRRDLHIGVNGWKHSAATAVRLGASILRQPLDPPCAPMASKVGAQSEAFTLIQAASQE
jgi:hypothetical protein